MASVTTPANKRVASTAMVTGFFQFWNAKGDAANKPSDAQKETQSEQNPKDQHHIKTIGKINDCWTHLLAVEAMHSH